MKKFKPVYKYPLKKSDGWKNLTGELPVKMTNDYLFRALLQSDNETLKEILAAVLHIDVRDIRSARIINEFLLGEQIDEKEFVLDVSVFLNDKENIDLEMQVVREIFWQDRSLSYICRSFDSLNRGAAYDETKPVKQVAFCDFTLFPDHPEFCATFMMLNEKKPEVVYSEKFVITNIDLTRIDLATEEDKKNKIDQWAEFFKAKTWEDMKMLAEKNESIGRAVSGVWQLTEEEKIRRRCRAREEWIINDNYKTKKLKEQEEELRQKEAALKQKDAVLSDQKVIIEQLQAENERLKNMMANKDDETS